MSTTVLGAEALNEHAARVQDQGWTILPGVLSADEVAALDDDLLRLERDLGITPSANAFEGVRTTRVYNLLVHGALYEAIPVHPGVLPVVERVLDPGLLISSLSSIAIGPGERAQPIHADDQLIPLPRPHPPLICNTMWAVTDFTEANGATRLVPRSHLAAEAPDLLAEHDTIPAEMEAGDVLVWVGSLWHGGGANRTDARRVGIAMTGGCVSRRTSSSASRPRWPAASPVACRSWSAIPSTTASSATSTSTTRPRSCWGRATTCRWYGT